MFGKRKTNLEKLYDMLLYVKNGGQYRWLSHTLDKTDISWLEYCYTGLVQVGYATYGGGGTINKIFDRCKMPHSGFGMGNIVFLNKTVEKEYREKYGRG